MARAAVLVSDDPAAVTGSVTPRTPWRVARIVAAREETTAARTLRLAAPGLGGNLPGQHVDIRLTAEDGYSAQRSYSIATAEPGDEIEVTVEELDDGEVSPYLVEDAAVGDEIEVRGPVGGWFVWHAADPSPVHLIAGGSGVVPLMAMIRAHAASASVAPFLLTYSARSADRVIFRDELARRVADEALLEVDCIYTRVAPSGVERAAGRLMRDEILARIPVGDPAFFLCGPTAFVETVSGWLVDAGRDPARIKTERFGG